MRPINNLERRLYAIKADRALDRYGGARLAV